MKNLQKLSLVFVLFTVTLFSFGQSRDDVLLVLDKAETRQMVMDTIAGDSIMSRRMFSRIVRRPRADRHAARASAAGRSEASVMTR